MKNDNLLQRAGALPELALRVLLGQVPGQATSPQELLDSALQILTRQKGTFGKFDPGAPSGEEFRQGLIPTTPEGKFDPERLKFPFFALGGVQSVPGISQALTSNFANQIPTTQKLPVVKRALKAIGAKPRVENIKSGPRVSKQLAQDLSEAAKFQAQTGGKVDALVRQVKSGKLTVEQLLRQAGEGKLNPDILQRVSEKLQGLDMLTKFNQAMGRGDLQTARSILKGATAAPVSDPIKQFVHVMQNALKNPLIQR